MHFKYSDNNKRYHTLNYYNKITYGARVNKAVLNAGFTCPNIDGNKGRGGCIFCSSGSGYFTNSSTVPIEKQLDLEVVRIKQKNPDAKIIAYFQANTNTYSDVETLKKIYLPLTENENIIGISIGTRPDCLSDEILDFLARLNTKTKLTIELGLQTIHDETALIINRCYNYSEFEKSFQKLKNLDIRTTVHIINGLPKETPEMMLRTAEALGKLEPDAVKIQMLHIIQNTELGRLYNGEAMLTKDEYINIVISQLELLPPKTVIERLTGDAVKEQLIAPKWTADKISVLGGIDKLMAEKNTYQGREFI